jgi:hypothetical protein
MFRRLRTVRTVQSPAPALIADVQAVRTAEAIVCRAWAEELLRRRDSMEAAVISAHESCEATYVLLRAALRDGDPRTIGLAQTAFERALELLRRSELARDHVHHSVQAELDVLAQSTRLRTAAAAARRHEGERPGLVRIRSVTPRFRPRRISGGGLTAMPVWLVYQWLGRLFTRDGAGPSRRRPP